MNIKAPEDGWVLIDGVEQNRQYPLSFEIPSEEERTSAKVENTVKIGYTSDASEGPSGERFWVIVKERTDDGRYVGQVDNDLVIPEHGIVFKDLVRFGPEHILMVLE